MDASKFVRGLGQARQKKIAAARIAVEKFGAMTVGVGQQLAPVGGGTVTPNDPAPGTLAGSGTWTEAKLEGDAITQEIGFNTIYATVQHEGLDFRHDQGEAKYLEKAMRAMTPRFAPYVGQAVNDVEE